MVAKLSLLQVVVSLIICICRTDDANTSLEDRSKATEGKALSQSNSKFALDESTIINFPVYRDGRIKYYINIVKELWTNRSVDFGLQLLGPERLSDIDTFKKELESANIRIILQWFEGRTENPITCRFLVKVLYNIGHIDLANDIRTTCEYFNVLDEPFRPRTFKRYSQELSEMYNNELIIETTLYLPKKLRGQKIRYVDLEMEEKGVNISLRELFDNIHIGMRVLFLGRPGVGKTTVTRYITKMLLDNKNWDLVVKIHLGAVEEIDSLETLLNVSADESFKPDAIQRISEFIKKTLGKGVVFLLDGYDEYHGDSSYVHGLLNRRYLKKSVVILTSRPKAAEAIKDDFDRKVEIIGFGHAGVQTYLEQLQLPDEKYEIINQYLSTHPNVRQLCYLPLHLSMLVYVAVLTGHDDALSVADTETELYLSFLSLTIKQYEEKRHEQTVESLIECFDDVYRKTDLCIIFRRIYQVSFEGLMSDARKNALTSASFTKLPDSSNISVKLEDLSLFKVVRIEDRRGVGLYKYYYSHPTFQAFFAAFHLTTLPRNEQLKYIPNYWMHEVYKFFLGLIASAGNYESEYLSQTFVSFSTEILSTYQNQELYIMKCSHETEVTRRNSNFVPFLQAAGVITESNSMNVYAFSNHDCWYIGFALLRSSFYKLSIDSAQLALCISFIRNYLEHENGILDRVDVENLAVGRYSEGYWPWFTEKEDSASFMVLVNFLHVFQKYLKHLELSFVKFENNESVSRLGDTLKSFDKLSFLALSVHVNVIKDGSLEIALKKLPFLNHLELGVINRHNENTPIPGNLLEFKNLTNLKSLTLALSWNETLVNVNMTSLFGGLQHLTNLKSLRVRIILYEGFRVYGATEMLQGIERLSIQELALELDLCHEHGLGNVSVKELATVLSKMTILRNLSLCIDFGFSGIRGNTGVSELSEGLKSLVNLQQLNLELRWELQTDESIDEGTEAMANALKQLHGLKALKLTLRHNGSISEIASAFPFLPKLQELQLKWKNFHDKTNVPILASGTKDLKQLKKLDLSWNDIGDEDVRLFVDTLKYLSVSTLDLSNNKIGDIGLKLLAQVIESGYLSSLQVLLLPNNMFSDNGADILSQKVVKLSKLRTFDLGLRQGKYSARVMTQIYQQRNATQKSDMKRHDQLHISLSLVVSFALDGRVVTAFLLGGMVVVAALVLGYARKAKHGFQHVISPNALNALATCSASSAWKLRSSAANNLDGMGTIIAIFDSYVVCKYPTLEGKNISTIDYILSPVNSPEHGTLCASVAIGSPVKMHETFIPEGVAPRATCFAYRVAENNLCTSEAFLKALDDIEMKIQNQNIQVDVVSISWDIAEGQDQIKQKILSLAERKVVFVAAAGNRGRYQHQSCFPACLHSVISVGALDRFGRKSKFNSQGRIDVFAPGEDIPFAGSTCCGTSFATPAIGGLVLLLKQHAKEIGSPACEYIHRVEILRKIFAEDMTVISFSGEKVFAPERFFESVTSGRLDLNNIVMKHLETLGETESSMDTD